ncbi:MAG: OB-fold domain-containing protein [Smithella sp.]|nr:OB-fold domain-containing protein [Smithella sp.]
MTYTKPLPQINPDTKDFWEGCRSHLLQIQKCSECEKPRWLSSFMCPYCLSTNTRLFNSSGRGKVYSFVVYHVAYHPSFKDDLPYVVALVDMEEGFRLLTNIIGCAPEEVHCDMEVEISWDDVTKDVSLPKFRPVVRIHP